MVVNVNSGLEKILAFRRRGEDGFELTREKLDAFRGLKIPRLNGIDVGL